MNKFKWEFKHLNAVYLMLRRFKIVCTSFNKAVKSVPVDFVEVFLDKGIKSTSVNFIKISLYETVEGGPVDLVEVPFICSIPENWICSMRMKIIVQLSVSKLENEGGVFLGKKSVIRVFLIMRLQGIPRSFTESQSIPCFSEMKCNINGLFQ